MFQQLSCWICRRINSVFLSSFPLFFDCIETATESGQNGSEEVLGIKHLTKLGSYFRTANLQELLVAGKMHRGCRQRVRAIIALQVHKLELQKQSNLLRKRIGQANELVAVKLPSFNLEVLVRLGFR